MSPESHINSVLSFVRRATLRRSTSKAKDKPKQTVAGSATPSGNAAPSIVPSTLAQTDTIAVPEKRPTSFFDLPPELRIMIYEYCVLDDKIRPYEYANKRMHVRYFLTPQEPPRSAALVTLSKVCRRTRMESEPILYGKNTILLPGGYLALEFFAKCLHNSVRRSWIKSVEIFWSGYDVLNHDYAVYLSNHIRADKRPGGKKRPRNVRSTTLMPEERFEMGKLVREAYFNFGMDTQAWLRPDYRKSHLHFRIQRLLSRPERLPAQIIWQPIMAFIQHHLQLDRLHFHFRPLARGWRCAMVGHGLMSFGNGFGLGMPELILADARPDQVLREDWAWFAKIVDMWTEDREHGRPTLSGRDPKNQLVRDFVDLERELDRDRELERKVGRDWGSSISRGWVCPMDGAEDL